jgi:hypothetical protein
MHIYKTHYDGRSANPPRTHPQGRAPAELVEERLPAFVAAALAHHKQERLVGGNSLRTTTSSTTIITATTKGVLPKQQANKQAVLRR